MRYWSRKLPLFGVAAVIAVSLTLAGCAGVTSGSTSNPPPKPPPPSAPQITTTSLANGQVGVAYQASLAATGGTTPYSWSVVSGALPTGLTLNASSGAITGTPTASGPFSFTAQVTDAASQSVQKALSISISAGSTSLTITTATLPSGQVGQPYLATLLATGGTPSYTWSVSAGQLPTGVTLSPASGQLSGTPTAAGQFSFTIQVADSASPAQTTTRAFYVGIVSGSSTLDQYGGFLAVTSPKGATGEWRVEKFGTRWMFVTPDGHPMWMLGLFAIQYDPAFLNVTAKYGSGGTATWGVQATRRMNAWGFNVIGEFSSAYTFPSQPNVTTIPLMLLYRPSWYGLRNQGGLAPQAFKELTDVQGAYTGYTGGALPDVFDPNFTTFANAFAPVTLNDPFWGGLATSHWSVGITIDETDQLYGFGPGPEINTGHTNSHIGWFVIAARPSFPSSTKWGQTYTDTKVYSKYELQAELQAKYGTIAVLNAAWGSNYTTWDSAGGYGTGTGFLDEDGRHTAWLGNTDGTLENAPAAVQADLDAFLYQFAVKYFAVTTAALHAVSTKLVFGPATLNGWFGISRKQVLQAAGQYLDVLNASAETQTVLDKTFQYAGDKPMVTWEGYDANPDSALAGYPGLNTYPTQAARGQHYLDRVNFLLNAATTTGGNFLVVGLKYWAWVDSWGEKLNWGLVSLKDNAYDGKEALIAPGVDPWGYVTGGELANYGDFITPVKTTNLTSMRTLCQQLGGTSCP